MGVLSNRDNLNLGQVPLYLCDIIWEVMTQRKCITGIFKIGNSKNRIINLNEFVKNVGESFLRRR